MALTQVSPGLLDSNAQYYAFKNRIINGAMQIDQRNAGASVTPNSSYTLDRWVSQNTQTGKFSVQQNSGSVTPPVGFTNYLGVTSLSAYSVGAGDHFGIAQIIEGYNVADLGWGTANAKTVTLSFWVRSSLTGTFGGCLYTMDNAYSYAFSYTISAVNTWEQKSVTIVGPTVGNWATNNTASIPIVFGLGTGSTYSTTAGSWLSGIYRSCTGNTSVVGTNGATFYITGVQLEKGSTATSFDYRPYGTELALCQRYYSYMSQSGAGNIFMMNFTAGGQANRNIIWQQTKRAAPTATVVSSTVANSGTLGGFSASSDVYGVTVASTASGLTYVTAFNVTFDAEL